MINRRELARLISKRTGFTIEDIEEVLEAEDYVIAEAIKQGIPVKKHKLFRLDIEERPEKKAWDGLNKRHFIVPAKKVVKFKPLSDLNKALEELNGEE